MKRRLLVFLFMFSVLFTFTTLLSTTIQLFQGNDVHSNAHIVMRSGFILIASVITVIFLFWEFQYRLLKYIISYFVAITMIMSLIFISGFFVDLHPDAYRDGFLNFTIIGIGVMAILYFGEGFYLKRPPKKHGVE